MPIATKRKVEERKSAPIIEAEPEPRPEQEELAPAAKVTAVIFSYDSAPALRRALAALEGSKDRNLIEILVVDCGSHDESPGLDSEFPNVTILRLPLLLCVVDSGRRVNLEERCPHLVPTSC